MEACTACTDPWCSLWHACLAAGSSACASCPALMSTALLSGRLPTSLITGSTRLRSPLRRCYRGRARVERAAWGQGEALSPARLTGGTWQHLLCRTCASLPALAASCRCCTQGGPRTCKSRSEAPSSSSLPALCRVATIARPLLSSLLGRVKLLRCLSAPHVLSGAVIATPTTAQQQAAPIEQATSSQVQVGAVVQSPARLFCKLSTVPTSSFAL